MSVFESSSTGSSTKLNLFSAESQSQSQSQASTQAPPAGPDFSDQNGLLSDSLTDEYISILSSENTEALRTYDDQTNGFFIVPQVVQHLFTICARMRLPDDVRFQAVDIFDRYMSLQTLYSYESIASLDETNSNKRDMWSTSFTTMSRQLTLRMCSAIQIASKAQSFHDSLSKSDVRKALLALGFPCTENMIQNSELRVLQILNFNIQIRRSPAQCLQSYLSILARKHTDISDRIDVVYQYGLLALDFVFLNRDKVFTSIFKSVNSKNPGTITNSRIRRTFQDFCLLGVSSCLIGIVCTLGESISTEFVPDLSEISLVQKDDIEDAVNGILKSMVQF